MENTSNNLNQSLVDRYLPRVAIIDNKYQVIESSPRFRQWFRRKTFSAKEISFLANSIQNKKFEKELVLESDSSNFVICIEPHGKNHYFLEIKDEIKKESTIFGYNLEMTLWNFLTKGPIHLWACNEKLEFEFFGSNWSKPTGGADNRYVEKNWLSFIHPEDIDVFYPIALAAMQKKEKFNLEYRVKRPDGTYSWITNQAFPYFENNEFKGYIGFNHDIQKRKEVEEALKFNQQRLQMAIETGQLGTWEWNVTSGECHFNDYWSKMLGYEPKEIKSTYQSFVDLIHPEDAQLLHQALMEHSIHKTNFFELDIRLKAKNGQYKWIHDRGKVVEYDANGVAKTIIGIHLDITNIVETRHSLSQKLKELDDKNIELQSYIDSNLELENFAYIASHDMKEPLRNITSFAQLLQRDLKNQKTKNTFEYIDFIITGAKNMSAFIEDLLEFSKVNTQELKLTDFDPMIAINAIKGDIHLHIENTKTAITCTNFPKTIQADKIKFKQILFNLISNGIKFQKENTAPKIEINCEEQKEKWFFSVKDNGIGIDRKFFDKIFLLFKRLHARESFTGTGMGLAICKKIVDRHGGQIWLESELGQGTTFHFSIAKPIAL